MKKSNGGCVCIPFLSFQCTFKLHEHVILLSSYIRMWGKYYVSMKCGYAYWSTIHLCDSNCEYLKGRFTVWHQLTVLSNNRARQLAMTASVTQWVHEIALHWNAESVSRSDSRSTTPVWLQRHIYLRLCSMHTRICEPYKYLQMWRWTVQQVCFQFSVHVCFADCLNLLLLILRLPK